MLSIIISSCNQDRFKKISTNISSTIGNIDFEIIKIWNPGKLSISKAYNEGISKSKFNYLLFIHEDIFFETDNWGLRLIDSFENIPNVGVIGVAGAEYKTRAPSMWWRSGGTDYCFFKQYNGDQLLADYTKNDESLLASYRKATILDGMFLAFDKREHILFDERLDGFHNYDIAICICFELRKKVNIIIQSLIIRHLSCGNNNMDWVKSTYHFYTLYKNILPLGSIQRKNSHLLEIQNYQAFIDSCLENRMYKLSIKCFIDLFKSYWWSIKIYKTAFKILYYSAINRHY